jgi:hypothetical protein
MSDGTTIAKIGRALRRCRAISVSPRAVDEHLVARAEHDRRVIVVGLHMRSKTSGAKIPRQQSIAGAFCATRKFFAWNILRNFERERSVGPDMPNDAPDRFLHAEIRRMIVSTMDYGDARMRVHEELEDLIAIGNDARGP